MPVHHLMVGTWTPPGAIFAFAFDDAALTLRLVSRTAIPVDEPISWMTFSHDKKAIYGAAAKAWSSYAVESPTSIVHQASFPMPHDPQALSPGADTRAIFLLAADTPPYAVYCNPFYSHAGAGSVFSVREPSGALAACVQNFAYQPGSGVHGTVFHPDGRHLYSADLSANKIWVHRRRAEPSPELDLVGAVDAPHPRDHPRWVVVHPAGTALYVLMEAGNRVCEYAIASSSPLPVFTGRHFSLVPPDEAHHAFARYRGDVCALSHSASHLFASTRASDPDRPGYLAAFELSPEGRLERRLLLQPTTTSGGHSNAVSPSDWTDEWLAVVEDQCGFLDIHRWHNHTLERVARVQVSEPGFGMNAIWYN
ncbi:lactonase, 7-bladed beta-propeller domain-containing protein [Hirsutella rhossiliensis]|uniref:Lactonase, 7-bladed beta-propeller domain-containing protein n=1 Tax=Hirsutella rhossiliensis TaxID=111463 RepID=A0A9P8SDG7_9HYPO|nr:lactonase, 7-bladed beta-propeller domain-containing protein [Hirsutella rhossiliensis]KAH0958728.1 lactonase, 7-bladed beta-propeller domain-containing protein [Hirsutella rhossiliensis]